MEWKSDLHGSNACRTAALISSSGYIHVVTTLHRTSLLRTQMFNDVYTGDESGAMVRKYLSDWERTLRHASRFDDRFLIAPRVTAVATAVDTFPALVEFPRAMRSQTDSRLINSLLHAPCLTRDCLNAITVCWVIREGINVRGTCGTIDHYRNPLSCTLVNIFAIFDTSLFGS